MWYCFNEYCQEKFADNNVSREITDMFHSWNSYFICQKFVKTCLELDIGKSLW